MSRSPSKLRAWRTACRLLLLGDLDSSSPAGKLKLLFRLTAAAVIALTVVIIVSLVAYFTVPPSFSVSAQKQPNGAYQITITPNFVVFSVYDVEVRDSRGVLAKRSEPREGPQEIIVPSSVTHDNTVTVRCELVYDRPMPCMTIREVTVPLR